MMLSTEYYTTKYHSDWRFIKRKMYLSILNGNGRYGSHNLPACITRDMRNTRN